MVHLEIIMIDIFPCSNSRSTSNQMLFFGINCEKNALRCPENENFQKIRNSSGMMWNITKTWKQVKRDETGWFLIRQIDRKSKISKISIVNMSFLKNEFRKQYAAKFLYLSSLFMVRSTLLVFCYLMAEMPFGSPRANVYFLSNICDDKKYFIFNLKK